MIKKLLIISSIVIFTGVLMIPSLNSVVAATASELQAQINALMAQVAQLQQQLTQIQGATAPLCHNFNVDLKAGDSGEEVFALQTALEKDGFAINDEEQLKKYFGESTASAVSGFQQKYANEILTPLGLTSGTGYVGKSTRVKLNSLYGCTVAPTTPATSIVKTSSIPASGDAHNITVITSSQYGTTENGIVTSDPTGINCGTTTGSVCKASFSGKVILTATPNSGYAFDSWYNYGNMERPEIGQDCKGNSGKCTITIKDTNITIQVKWKLVGGAGNFDVGIFEWGNVVDDKGKVNCDSKASYTVCRSKPYTVGESVTFTAKEIDTGGVFTFNSWSSCGNCDSKCENDTYKTKCGSNKTCTLDIPPTFSDYDGVPSIMACFKAPDGYKNLSALFQSLDNGYVSSNPGKFECGTKQGVKTQACSYSYPQGTPVILTAHPESGYQFGGWVGHVKTDGTLRPGFSSDCKDKTKATCTITIPSDINNIGWFFEKGSTPPPPPTVVIENGKLYGDATIKVNTTTGISSYCAGPNNGVMNSPISCGSDKKPVCTSGFRRTVTGVEDLSATERGGNFTCEAMEGTGTTYTKGGLYGVAVIKLNTTNGTSSYCAGPKPSDGTSYDGALNNPISCGSDNIPKCQAGFRRVLTGLSILSATEQEKYFTCEAMEGTGITYAKGGLYGTAVIKINKTTNVSSYCAGPKPSDGTSYNGALNSPMSCASNNMPECTSGFRRVLTGLSILSDTEQEKYYSCEAMESKQVSVQPETLSQMANVLEAIREALGKLINF